MAPEINFGVNFQGKSADIFALGVLLFIMSFGVPFFEEALDEDYVFFFMQKRRTFFQYFELEGDSANANKFNRELISLIKKMLNPNPTSRPELG